MKSLKRAWVKNVEIEEIPFVDDEEGFNVIKD